MSQHDDTIPRPPAGLPVTALSRRAFVGLAGAAGCGLAAGCGTTGLKSSGNSAASAIRIGYISPRTGSDAPFATADPFVLSKVRQALAKGLRGARVAQQLITQHNIDIMLTTSTPETVNPVSDQCEAAHVPCIGTIVPWQSWFLGRGGKIGTSAATSTQFKYTWGC